MELFTACGVASLGLHIAPANDIRILKVVIFSRAVNSLVSYFGETTGIFRPVEHKEKRILTVEFCLAYLACFFIVFCFIHEPTSMSPSLFRTVNRAMDMDAHEMRLFDCLRALYELSDKIDPRKAPVVKPFGYATGL